MTLTRDRIGRTKPQAPARAAEIVREYGPFEGAERIHGVTHDGRRVWAATGSRLVAFDPESGQLARTLDRAGDAGTAFDGTHLYQIAEARIDKIDLATGEVVASIPAPGHGGDSGLAWAEGSLWVGQYRDRKIHQVDPETGTILRTIESNRFVTGVTWVDGELWHGTWEGDESEIRRIDPDSGAVLERLDDAARHRRQRDGVRRGKPFLLRWRSDRKGSRRAQAQALTTEQGVRDVSQRRQCRKGWQRSSVPGRCSSRRCNSPCRPAALRILREGVVQPFPDELVRDPDFACRREVIGGIEGCRCNVDGVRLRITLIRQ